MNIVLLDKCFLKDICPTTCRYHKFRLHNLKTTSLPCLLPD